MIRDIFQNRLLISDAVSARDLKSIYDQDIAAVVDLAANEPPAVLGRDIIYCRFPLHDDESNTDEMLTAAIQCLRSLLQNNFRILVACSAGMSRSPTIAAAAISMMSGESLQDCLLSISSQVPHDVSPSLLESVVHICEKLGHDS
ncbi:hypothetical protein Q31b_37820 [Novipirellula aureliae]|uniref:Dual specificity phosphatase catalytic domain-containing protein n=1 Tax=Novipirellula aureliae TaxID=2527966 RepID=A0A5C6DR90_9BACT|nr:dual specificity protein phosphatase [Novipirellula aureliae]TWU38704.1 hypothetical protein Q31b_37820 [Novipirellula aureliae]